MKFLIFACIFLGVSTIISLVYIVRLKYCVVVYEETIAELARQKIENELNQRKNK